MDSSQYSHFDNRRKTKSKSRGQKRYSNVLTPSEKSEGEVGKESDNDDQSLGEIQVPGPETTTFKRENLSRQNQAQFRQTINYEEEKIHEDALEKPIYESTEGPIPKGRGKNMQGNQRR